MADEETPASTDVEVTVQPTLPELELPDYHGRKATGMKTAVTGAGNRVSRAHELGDRVVLVVEAKVKKAGHEELDDGLLYAESLKVVDLFEIQGPAGKRLLSSVRQAYRTADDQVRGRPALADGDVDLSAAGVTDASGTVLTPAELAELRGDPVRSMLDDRATPVVVVYSDKARELWPDDFEKDAARPNVGDRFEVEGEGSGPVDYVYVEELLHADTGETLAKWSKDQEDARLLELEKKAEAEEQGIGETGPELVTVPSGTASFYRIEHADGSVSEDPAKPERGTEDPTDRIVAVFADGTEVVVKESGSGLDEFEVGDADGPIDGDPLLPGEPGFEATDDSAGEPWDAGLEPLEVEFREDDDGFAEPVSLEPTPDDYALVDRQIDELPELLAQVDDLVEARRILEAEKRGRGRNLKTRKGAVDFILRRIADLEKGPFDAS